MSELQQEKLELGATIGAMIQNSDTREELANTLSREGNLTVLADTADTVNLVVPANLDTQKIADGDEDYLMEIGRRALAACVYHIVPK